MRQNNAARSFYGLLTLLALLAGMILLASIVFNSEGWLRQMRTSLPVGVHSPLYADYSTDLRGGWVAPAELRLLEDALRDQHSDPAGAIGDLLTPVPTVTPRLEDLLPVTVSPTGPPTATLLPGVTPTLTWTPTLTLTFQWTSTATAWFTRTPGPSPTRTPTQRFTLTPSKTAQWTPTHTPQPSYTHSPQPSPTSTPTQPPTPTRTPQPTPTSGGYPPPVTPEPTTPGYP